MDGLKRAKTWALHCSCNQSVSVSHFYLGTIVRSTEETAAYSHNLVNKDVYNRDGHELY